VKQPRISVTVTAQLQRELLAAASALKACRKKGIERNAPEFGQLIVQVTTVLQRAGDASLRRLFAPDGAEPVETGIIPPPKVGFQNDPDWQDASQGQLSDPKEDPPTASNG
jgi:hypothetical protein